MSEKEMQHNAIIINPDHRQGSIEFRRRFDLIKDRKLEVEQIEVFFENAVDDLTQLTGDMRSAYVGNNSQRGEQMPREEEDHALRYYSLEDINIDSFLDEAERKRQLVLQAGEFVHGIRLTDELTSPPKKGGRGVMRGSGEFRVGEVMKRLETLLYILLAHGIELSSISDSQKGAVRPDMFRKEGYVTLVISSINRAVQVCNQRGYDTYMFDLKKIKNANMDMDTLDHMTKEEKDTFLRENSGLGTSFSQSSEWVKRVEYLLFDAELVMSEPKIPTERKPKKDGLPEVSTSEIDPWKDFWEDENKKHWGFMPAMKDMISRTYGVDLGIQKLNLDLKEIPEEQFPRRLIRDSGGKEGKAFCYEDFLELDMMKIALSVPSVEKTGEWAGFWKDTKVDDYRGTVASISQVLKQKHSAIQYLIEGMAANNELSGIAIRDINGHILGGYPFQPIKKRVEELLLIPLADQKGEWKGFYVDPDRGRHVGALKKICKRLTISNEVIERVVKRLGLTSEKIRVRGFQTADAFHLEPILNDPEIVEWVDLRKQGLVVSKKADAEKNIWKSFYTDQDGKHWGTVHAISETLRKQGTIHTADTLLAKFGKIKKIRVITETKGPSDAYCFEDAFSIIQGGHSTEESRI